MFSETYADMTELAYGLTRRVAMAKEENLDFVNSADVQVHDVMVKAKRMTYDFDLKQMWVGTSRWTNLVRQYIDPVALGAFLELIEDKMKGMTRGQAFMRTKTVRPRKTGARETRRWGSCIIGFGFHAHPTPSLSMHSRTTFLGYIGELDLAVAYVLAGLIAERLGIKREDISFTWHIEAAQFHSGRSLAWWFKHDLQHLLVKNSKKLKPWPGVAAAARQYQRYLKMDEEGVRYGDLSFASQLRPRKRIHTEVHGYEYGTPFEGGDRLKSGGKRFKPLPSVPVDKLDFSKLRDDEGDPDEAGLVSDGLCCEE